MFEKKKDIFAGALKFLALGALVWGLSGQSLAQQAADIAQQYVLQTGDRIYIQVFDEPDLTMKATVGQSGTINYSYLGTVDWRVGHLD